MVPILASTPRWMVENIPFELVEQTLLRVALSYRRLTFCGAFILNGLLQANQSGKI